MVLLRRIPPPSSNASKRPLSEPEPTVFSPAAVGDELETLLAVLADAGCTLRVPGGSPPILPSDPHLLSRHLSRRLSADPSLPPRFLAGLFSYLSSPSNLHSFLVPASQDHVKPAFGQSVMRALLSVPLIQPQVLNLLLEKLPEHFDHEIPSEVSIQEDVARLIVSCFRWLDFIVDGDGFVGRLMEVTSIAPLRLKKEIIGSLPEIIGDQSVHSSVVHSLEQLLMEDVEIIIPVLDSFSSLNLDEKLQEQAVTVAISCIRTVEPDHLPQLLRFLLLSATPGNTRRIISQIREHLKFGGVVDLNAVRNMKLKGKLVTSGSDAAILETLRSSLRFKNNLCEAVLKELRCIHDPQNHKVIDVWLLLLIYANGGLQQKSAEKVIMKKVVQGCLCEGLVNSCIYRHWELVKDYFRSFISMSEHLLVSKENKAREFATYLFVKLFEEFTDIYQRQEVLGALVAHIGSGVAYEVRSALDTMILLTSKYSEGIIPSSSHIAGMLDYLEGFNEDDLRKVYDIFCHLALHSHLKTNPSCFSISNELLMIVRKQINNPDIKYVRMGITGILRILSAFGDAETPACLLSSQKSNCEELELLTMALNACKVAPLPLLQLYDELISLLESKSLRLEILEWLGKHVGEFESLFLSDLQEGQLISEQIIHDMEGCLWMNLDGELSPICLNIFPLVPTPSQRHSSSLHILPSQFSLLSVIERLTNQGSLGGIDALVGCPLHLPSPKYLDEANWRKLSEEQRTVMCFSLFYAVNWLRELINAFSTQVYVGVDTVVKLFKRLRNLCFLEGLLNYLLKLHPVSLPELFIADDTGSKKFVCPKKTRNNIDPGSSSTCPKRKRSEDKAKSDCMQPTILDAFKKAGVVVEQGKGSCTLEPSVTASASSGVADCSPFETEDLMDEPVNLERQRFKFRPLRLACFILLNFTEAEEQNMGSPDPEAELPLHLYLLRDLHGKIDSLRSPSKQNFTATRANPRCAYGRFESQELLEKINPTFASLKKHLMTALSLLNEEHDIFEDRWHHNTAAVGNPTVACIVISKFSAATSLVGEVLSCFRKILSLPELLHEANMSILKGLLGTFQTEENLQSCLPDLEHYPNPHELDYLHCSCYIFFEHLLHNVLEFSYTLACETLMAMQSIVSCVSLSHDKYKANLKNGRSTLLPFLQRRLAGSAHRFLTHNLRGAQFTENGARNRGDIVQKILQIYIRNSASSTDLLDELACSMPGQVNEGTDDFPAICSEMILQSYRVLHEENLGALSRTIKTINTMSQLDLSGDSAERVLNELCKSVKVFVSLINMCKSHEKVSVHAMAVRYGGKFVDTFLKAFKFLETRFGAHNEVIIQMFTKLQKATRLIQTICSEAKGSKRTMITIKIPATKRSMERFLFHVKALFHNSAVGHSFWIGNLKHKDLLGQVVSSQAYCSGGSDDDELQQSEMEIDGNGDGGDCCSGGVSDGQIC